MKKLEQDDISVGMYITVVRGYPIIPAPPLGDDGEEVVPRAVVMLAQSTQGEWYQHVRGSPLKVLAVNHPFVACLALDHGKRLDIDMRRCELIPVDKFYVDSLRKKRWWEFWR